jgi:hypothetical protein
MSIFLSLKIIFLERGAVFFAFISCVFSARLIEHLQGEL